MPKREAILRLEFNSPQVPPVRPHFSERTKKAVTLVGCISFLWSMSSLMVFSILPVFLTETLKVSHVTVGLIEGVAIFASFVAKIFSGVLCDLFRNRKTFILVGTFLSILGKMLFPFAITPMLVFFARFIDRTSKGIRSAPADAYVADICQSKEEYSYAYGVRQGLYTFGGACGAAVAMILLAWTTDHFLFVFACAVIPVILSFFLCFKLPKAVPQPLKNRPPISLKKQLEDIKQFPRRFWMIMIVCGVFMIARFGEVFVTLRAKELGCPVVFLPLPTIFLDIIHASCAFYLGKKITRKKDEVRILQLGILVFIVTHFIFMGANNLYMMFLGVSILGIHLGMTQGVLRSMLAEASPVSARGTAFAVFYLVCGASVLIGNTLAGALSDAFGLYSSFLAGGVLSFFAFLLSFKLKVPH